MELTTNQRDELIRQAREARKNAYAPYSNYPVGAALLTEDGAIYRGANVENAAYPTGTCAERSAAFAAVSDGARRFNAIAIASENGGSPCGACRQVLSEFGLDMVVLVVDGEGEIALETTLRELLPDAFTPSHLPGT